jgi:hypothetical protein
MNDITRGNSADVNYVVEMNGSKHSEHGYFVEAIKAELLLREQNPHSRLKILDISDPKSNDMYREWPPKAVNTFQPYACHLSGAGLAHVDPAGPSPTGARPLSAIQCASQNNQVYCSSNRDWLITIDAVDIKQPIISASTTKYRRENFHPCVIVADAMSH